MYVVCAFNFKHMPLTFDSLEKCESVISVKLAICGSCLYVAIFSVTKSVMNVKLCMVVVLFELYPSIPLSATLTAIQGY